MNKGGILYVISIFVIISCTSLHAQDPVVEPHDSITTPPSSLIFIPADWDKVGPNAIETEIADLFIDAAINLDIIEVVDWLYADDVIYDESIDVENQIDPPLALFIGEIGRIDHVYLFKINSFIQEGREDIPDDRSFTDKLSAFFINMLDDEKTTSSESYPKNIHTEIEIELDLIDVRKAEIIRNFLIQAQYTGGRKYYSRTKLMDIIYHRIQDELKRQYLSSFSIYNLETNIQLLREPGEQILERGDMLELYEPDQIDYAEGAEIRTPGKPVAYCQVQEKTLKYYRTERIVFILNRCWYF
ncbi:MAG: hypothetical protein P8Y99_10360 [Calditrichaceae bacterium]